MDYERLPHNNNKIVWFGKSSSRVDTAERFAAKEAELLAAGYKPADTAYQVDFRGPRGSFVIRDLQRQGIDTHVIGWTNPFIFKDRQGEPRIPQLYIKQP